MDRTWPHKYVDEETGETRTKNLCWDCDFDIINGRGGYDDDPAEIAEERWEEEYEMDPINVDPPPWYYAEEGRR